jgi:hypothetical protein
MKSRSFDAGWALVLLWITAALGIWFLASIADNVDRWLMANQHLSAWVQAVGTIAAILAAAWIARRQERKAAHAAKSIAVKKAVTFAATVQNGAEEVREKGSMWTQHSKLRRLVLEEAVLDARTIDVALLNLEWLVAVHGLRSIAVQMCEVMRQFESSSEREIAASDPRYQGLARSITYEKMATAIAEYEPKIQNLIEILRKKHPGVDAYAE